MSVVCSPCFPGVGDEQGDEGVKLQGCCLSRKACCSSVTCCLALSVLYLQTAPVDHSQF